MRRSAPLRLPANSSHPSRGKSHATPAIVTIVTDVDKLYKILPIIRITFINRTAITDSREASRGEEFFFSEKAPPPVCFIQYSSRCRHSRRWPTSVTVIGSWHSSCKPKNLSLMCFLIHRLSLVGEVFFCWYIKSSSHFVSHFFPLFPHSVNVWFYPFNFANI